MPPSIAPVRVNHVNLVLSDHEESVRHFEELFGARFLVDMPQEDWHACLIDIGRVIFEVFVPNNFFLSTRHGPHHLGIEYQADVASARTTFGHLGIRIARDIDVAVHAHPADCQGVAFEFWDGFFHDNAGLVGTMEPASYWRDEHPLGLTGLLGNVVLTPDLDEGRRFLTRLFDCELLSEDDRPAVAARAARYRVADAVIELAAPTGDGLLLDALVRSGPGIHSTVFGVRDLDQAQAYFDERGVQLVDGSAPGRLAVPAVQNLGLVFELEAAS